MKLQGLAIIFIIIVVPMILILSYYLGLQIDTITLQNRYENALIDATGDAINALELNTANEDLSTVSDALRSIVMASTNTFFNTFSTSIGLSNASKSNIQPYVPAMLYTLYDGYYIYAPTYKPVVLEKSEDYGDDPNIKEKSGYITVGDPGTAHLSGTKYSYNPSGGGSSYPAGDDNYGSILYETEKAGEYTIDTNDAKHEVEYILKSFTPYSATYASGNSEDAKKATINYTLDNFMNISYKTEGNVDNAIYYTKSGYYIDDELLVYCDISNWQNLSQEELKNICETQTGSISIGIKDGGTITSEIDRPLADLQYDLQLLDKDGGITTDEENARYRELLKKVEDRKSIEYYLTNTIFSKWVNDNLGWIVPSTTLKKLDVMEVTGDMDYYSVFKADISGEDKFTLFHNFESDTEQIFKSGIDPEDSSLAFCNHKYHVIRNSITYNLNLAISSYSKMFPGLIFEMPELTEEEWYEITEKISLVAYVQGLNCGLKNFYGYALVSSTNNEMTVIPDEIYYVKDINSFNDASSEYHRIDCSSLDESADLRSFKSKEVKYDEVYHSDSKIYAYDHKNLACYKCIINGNYKNNDGENKEVTVRQYLGFDGSEITNHANKRISYLKAVGKERQMLYKTTEFSKSEGIKTKNPESKNANLTWDSNEIVEARVTTNLEKTAGETRKIYVGGSATNVFIPTSQLNSRYVFTLDKDDVGGGAITCPENEDGTGESIIKILSIEYVYK